MDIVGDLEDLIGNPLLARLKAAGVSHEFYRYAPSHAFGNESGPHYDAALKELAWNRSLQFFARHLSTS